MDHNQKMRNQRHQGTQESPYANFDWEKGKRRMKGKKREETIEGL